MRIFYVSRVKANEVVIKFGKSSDHILDIKKIKWASF